MTAHHVMQLTALYETDAEEWTCPICDYQLVMTWPPDYKKIPLMEGDQSAAHSCEKNGLAVISDEPIPDEFQDWIDKQGG